MLKNSFRVGACVSCRQLHEQSMQIINNIGENDQKITDISERGNKGYLRVNLDKEYLRETEQASGEKENNSRVFER